MRGCCRRRCKKARKKKITQSKSQRNESQLRVRGARAEVHVVFHRRHPAQTQAAEGGHPLTVLRQPGLPDAHPGVRIPADANPDPCAASPPSSAQAGASPVLLHVWYGLFLDARENSVKSSLKNVCNSFTFTFFFFFFPPIFMRLLFSLSSFHFWKAPFSCAMLL